MTDKDRKNRYCEYIDNSLDYICKAVNEKFEETKDFSRQHFIKIIADMVDKDTIHYEWEPNPYEPWDSSGELVPSGFIQLDQTVDSFLDNEYTGQWMPTYESGCGKRYETFGDRLSFDTQEYSETIMRTVVRRVLEEAFSETMDDDIFDDVMGEKHDDIYDMALTTDFFFWENMTEYYGIGQYRLMRIIRHKGGRKRH